ncbi:RNA cap guanine-N2 methyltransferase [Gracilaria domingensis]|nr:RNA cap guanine-N2 methyltransferase [Gracilaria domingensis]
MSDVQTGLEVRTSESVVQEHIRNDLDSHGMSLEAKRSEARDRCHEGKESQSDARKALLPLSSILDNGQRADQNVIHLQIEERGTSKETDQIFEVPEVVTEGNHKSRSGPELANIENVVTVDNSKTTANQSNSPSPAWFIDRNAGDFVRSEANSLKISKITERISNRISKVSHVARKVPRKLKVSVKHIQKSMQAPKRLAKYYFQRYRLFHRFDEGVLMDEVSWYSVTPEKIAKHIAERFAGRELIVDLYSGAGGNSIQFALNGAYVIAVELSQSRIEIARNNARVYGVEQYIEFIAADVVDALKMMKDSNMLVDGIFLSPPWGGPEYQETESYDVGAFKRVVDLARTVTKDVGILLPRNVNGENVLKWFGPCEMEWNYLGNKAKTVTVYFGDLIRFPDDY